MQIIPTACKGKTVCQSSKTSTPVEAEMRSMLAHQGSIFIIPEDADTRKTSTVLFTFIASNMGISTERDNSNFPPHLPG
jgi:hypothetical protein